MNERLVRIQESGPAPGRPRDPEVEQRILAVALRQLAEQGYSRMSLDGVAEEAGVSKPTIYRRWKGKADLATAALRTLQLGEEPVRTESAKGDLKNVLRNFRRSLLRPNGMSLIGTVLAEEQHTPELLSFFRKRLVQPRRATIRTILARAQAAGELRKVADLSAASSMLVGAFYARYLEIGAAIPENWGDQLVEIVWNGLQSQPSSSEH